MSRAKTTSGEDKAGSKSSSELAGMTAAEIQAARDRLKKLAQESPPPDQQKQGGVTIVKQLYDLIAKARSKGWNWPKIQAEIGGEVLKWKPATLERYFQLAKARPNGGSRKVTAATGVRRSATPPASQPGAPANSEERTPSKTGTFKANVLD